MVDEKTNGTILILGTGLVSPPIIEYLNNKKYNLILASRTVSKSEKIVENLNKDLIKIHELNIVKDSENDFKVLESLVPKADVVVSLLPYIYHVQAAKIAIKYKKHFCTTSYVSPQMQALDKDAKDNGVLLLNECGVDPGLDHCSAMKIIDEIHNKGGKIISFTSICGGLPAPKDNNNPYGYKLSWSPRGVLLASKNSAVFYENGKKVQVPNIDLFASKTVREETIDKVGDLEWYPNRDSCMYKDIYKIPEIQTLIRGTYRYAGWCATLKSYATLGLINTETIKDLEGKTYLEFVKNFLKTENDDVSKIVAEKLELKQDDPIIKRMEWIGLFSKNKIGKGVDTALDVLCSLFEKKLVYENDEQDMIVMKHEFEVEYPNLVRETITSTLIDTGLQPKGHSSMARTVSLPLAVAINSLLQGDIKLTGCHRPVIPELYNLILKEMEKENVVFVERVLPTHIWVRSETGKPGEKRVAVTPKEVSKLLADGYRVTVEKNPMRIIDDEEYAKTGCKMVESDSWVNAPHSTIILGLKELPESKDPLQHRHIFFAHCYKQQGGWKDVLNRFKNGGGVLYDIEFLKYENGRRIAAFGRPAGLVGMALGLLQWSIQILGEEELKNLKFWKSCAEMCKQVNEKVKKAIEKKGSKPKIIVVGALGRCGKGAIYVANQCNLEPTAWDLAETKVGGPFKEIPEHDILVNCIYLTSKIPHYLTMDMMKSKDRKLSVFVDVSCDTSNPNNPYPVYNQGTTLFNPVLNVLDEKEDGGIFDVVAIDHLPALLPAESSENFAEQFIPHLLNLKDITTDGVWARASKLYSEKIKF